MDARHHCSPFRGGVDVLGPTLEVHLGHCSAQLSTVKLVVEKQISAPQFEVAQKCQ